MLCFRAPEQMDDAAAALWLLAAGEFVEVAWAAGPPRGPSKHALVLWHDPVARVFVAMALRAGEPLAARWTVRDAHVDDGYLRPLGGRPVSPAVAVRGPSERGPSIRLEIETRRGHTAPLRG